jgi:hypothetical protein
VFARCYKSQEDADAAVYAADAAFEYFARFKRDAIDAQDLSLRATATIAKTLLHPEASHWLGVELNEFLKYERELGLSGAFVITQKLCREIAATQRRFPHARGVRLPNGSEISTYTDQNHPFALTESPKRFMTWLKKNADQLPPADYHPKGMLEKHVAIGNAVVVDTALSEAGYYRAHLIQTEFPESGFQSLVEPFKDDWERLKATSSHLTGTKAPVLRVTPPVSDDPTLYIEYASIGYNIIRPFHKLVQDNLVIRTTLSEQAFMFQHSAGRRMPGALAVDAAIIFDEKPSKDLPGKEHYLLLAHRVYRESGYYPNCWSASFEEQFAPVKSEWGGKIHPADGTMNDTAIRGLREEFLSESYTGIISVAFQAVFVDLQNLNLQLLAAISLPETSFSDIRELWSSGQAVDSSEHDVLAAIKLEPQTLRKALSAEGPDGSIAFISDSALESAVKDHWHPRSQARIACCLWMLEEGLI